MLSNHKLLLIFIFSWLLMLVLDFYFVWFNIPDLILLAAATVFFYSAHHQFWCCLLPISLLADVSASVPLFFHAFFYATALLMMYALHRTWRETSTAGRLFLILLMSAVLQFMRYLFLYWFTGGSAPRDWFWSIPLQFLVWVCLHAIALHILSSKHE